MLPSLYSWSYPFRMRVVGDGVGGVARVGGARKGSGLRTLSNDTVEHCKDA